MRVWLWLRRELSSPPIGLPIPVEVADANEAHLLSEALPSEALEDEADAGAEVPERRSPSRDPGYISPAYRPENRLREGSNPDVPDGVRVCRVCGEPFRPTGATGAVFDRCGRDSDAIDFCNPCMAATVIPAYSRPRDDLTAAEIREWLRAVADAIQRRPNQNFPTKRDLAEMTRDERERIVRLCQDRPSVEAVKAMFGSWRAALVAAGLK